MFKPIKHVFFSQSASQIARKEQLSEHWKHRQPLVHVPQGQSRKELNSRKRRARIKFIWVSIEKNWTEFSGFLEIINDLIFQVHN